MYQKSKYGRLLAQLHRNFTSAHADGCGAQCFVGVQRASIFSLPVRHGPQAATPALRSGVDRSLPGGRSWRTGRMARYKQNVSVCLILRRQPPAGLSFSMNIQAMPSGSSGQGKGEKLVPTIYTGSTLKPVMMPWISFVSSLSRISSSTHRYSFP